MYNIVKKDELQFINAYIPLEFFEEKRFDKNYLFLSYKNSYIMVWFANDYLLNNENSSCEFISKGRKNAFICNIKKKDDYSSFDEFVNEMKSLPIVFNSENMSVKFNDICIDYNKRTVGDEEQVFPYTKLFDNPYVKSDYYSAIYDITDGENSIVYDFNF